MFEVGPDEPVVERWQVMPISALLEAMAAPSGDAPARPWVIAVDGRSAGGKSTLATRMAMAVPGATVVHTDDIAWHHDFFAWSDLLIDGVLRPLRAGESVRYRPPGWVKMDRPGAVEVNAGCPLVLVEGVGASRIEVAPWIDRAIWVQSDFGEAEQRGIERDGGTAEARAFWAEWMAAEMPFLSGDRPWERADVIVNGTPALAHDPELEVVVAIDPGDVSGRELARQAG